MKRKTGENWMDRRVVSEIRVRTDRRTDRRTDVVVLGPQTGASMLRCEGDRSGRFCDYAIRYRAHNCKSQKPSEPRPPDQSVNDGVDDAEDDDGGDD